MKALAHCSKVITCSKVKHIQRSIKLQGQGHKVKNVGTHRKVWPLAILNLNIKALALRIQKFKARLKLSKSKSNSKVKVTGYK